MDASKEIRNMSSDTSTLDSIMGGMTVAGAPVCRGRPYRGCGARAMRMLPGAAQVAGCYGGHARSYAIQNQLQSQSALRLGVTRVPDFGADCCNASSERRNSLRIHPPAPLPLLPAADIMLSSDV